MIIRLPIYRNKIIIVVTIVILLLNIIIIISSISYLDTTTPTTHTTTATHTTIEYGSLHRNGIRVPLVMIHSNLDNDIHQRFLQYPMFSCNENDLNNSFHGLENRVKHPIYIYEGYYHSCITSLTIWSRNPNPTIAKDFDKPAADTWIRSYFESFRRVNAGLFIKLRNDLINSAITRIPNNPDSDICYGFSKWIDKGYIAGDVSIQIHYGKNNDDNFNRGIAWHTDALNSLLHLAITIRGNRVLHSYRSNTSTSQPVEVLEPQGPGSIYLSSSALMKHAPKFSDTKYDTRVIAIHARILYTTNDMNSFTKNITDSGWTAITTIIANTLSTQRIAFPSLKQIQLVEKEINNYY